MLHAYLHLRFTNLHRSKLLGLSLVRTIFPEAKSGEKFLRISCVFFRKIGMSLADSETFERPGTQMKEMDVERASFTIKTDVQSGKSEWLVLPNDYDFHQEIARSAYADMLHDHDRNMKYFEAIKFTVEERHKRNERVIVLDIGTGTGLLSMMAAKCGADEIYACEAFEPMFRCAKKVVEANGYDGKIKLIHKRSTDLKVGEDIPQRANVLVTEVFDTELIGEGAIATYNHALRNLMTEDCDAVPKSAVVWAMLVDCEMIKNYNRLKTIRLDEGKHNAFQVPNFMNLCGGLPSCHDLQISSVPSGSYFCVTEPLKIFEFDWEKVSRTSRSCAVPFQSLMDISAVDGLVAFCWWDLFMDKRKKQSRVISCRPSWQGNEHWRDHWMQWAQLIPNTVSLSSNKKSYLTCHHDEFSFRFGVSHDESDLSSLTIPFCQCGLHATVSRTRLAALNDSRNRKFYADLFSSLDVQQDTVVLIISDSPFLLVYYASVLTSSNRIHVLESNEKSMLLTDNLCKFNGLDGRVKFIRKQLSSITRDDFQGNQVDVVVGDPYFHFIYHPWDNLHFYFALDQLRGTVLSESCIVCPKKAIFKGVPLSFDHLWKINAPVNTACNGEFDLRDFDQVIEASSAISDSLIDVQPLWEYPAISLCNFITFFELDLDSPIVTIENLKAEGCIQSDLLYKMNGFALWMEWQFTEDLMLSFGPVHECKLNEYVDWDRTSKQGVILCDSKKVVKNYSCSYKAELQSSGKLSFKLINI